MGVPVRQILHTLMYGRLQCDAYLVDHGDLALPLKVNAKKIGTQLYIVITCLSSITLRKKLFNILVATLSWLALVVLP